MTRLAIVGTAAALGLSIAAFGQSSSPQSSRKNGNVTVFAAPKSEVVRLSTTLVVPELPVTKVGTVFLWPGLQPMPYSRNFLPIGNGVLQSVLSFGPSCAPPADPQYARPDGWWISGQYVNTPKRDLVGFRGCFGGPNIGTVPGDELLINMSLTGTIWNQTVLDMRSGESVAFGVDLRGQAQAYARFNIEPHDGARAPDLFFQNTTIGFALSDAQNCDLRDQGPDDVVTARVLASDSLSCSIETISLKSPSALLPTKARPKQH